MVRLRADIFHHTPTGEVNQQGDDQTGAAQVVGYRIAELVGITGGQRQRSSEPILIDNKQREAPSRRASFLADSIWTAGLPG